MRLTRENSPGPRGPPARPVSPTQQEQGMTSHPEPLPQSLPDHRSTDTTFTKQAKEEEREG